MEHKISFREEATHLQDSAALYESVNEEQRAALDGIAATAFGDAPRHSTSLPADGYQPQCVRQPLARMSSALTSSAPEGDYGLVHTILTTEWTSPSALVLQAIGECFKKDPLELVTVRFGGDWAQVDVAAQAAGAIAWCFSSIGDNIADATRGCRELWTGAAADAAFAYLDALAKAAREVGTAAEDVEQTLGAVAEAMFAGGEKVAGLFAEAMDCIGGGIVIAGLGGATATTVVGPALATLIDGLLAAKAFKAVAKAIDATQTAISDAEFAVQTMRGVGSSGGHAAPIATIPLPGGSA